MWSASLFIEEADGNLQLKGSINAIAVHCPFQSQNRYIAQNQCKNRSSPGLIQIILLVGQWLSGSLMMTQLQ